MFRVGTLSLGLVLVAAASSAEPVASSPPVPTQLLEKRREAAQKVCQLNIARLKGGQGAPSDVFGWSDRWLEGELALTDKKADRVRAAKDHLDRSIEVERMAAIIARTGQGKQADAEAATYFRLEAEIRLLKEEAQPKGEERPAKR